MGAPAKDMARALATLAASLVLLTFVAAVPIKRDNTVPAVKLNNGLEMPLVSLGVWKYNDTQAYDACTTAHKVGFTAFDTAYGEPFLIPRRFIPSLTVNRLCQSGGSWEIH